MERNLSLDFRCCGCERPVGVTVQCCGPGTAGALEHPGAPNPCARANVPCPNCGQVNQLLFEPTGELRCVRPLTCYRPLPAPSIN